MCTDGRQGSPALARTVGPFAETEPVLLPGTPDDTAREFLGRVAGSLADVGCAVFSACREYTPDPALRLAMRELVPVLVRFTPDADVRTAPRPDRAVVPYALDIVAWVRGRRLRVGLDWLPAVHDGITEESVGRLLSLTKDVLQELAGGPDAVPSAASTVAASPLQRALLADADAHPGTGRQIEQLRWVWHGPLDIARFTAAWQSVFDREAVLRAAFDHRPEPRITLHDRVVPDVVRRAHAGARWSEALADDRWRGLDPRSPGPLRVTLFDGPPDDGTSPPSTRVLLTYHQALLDTWSVRLLLAEFYRAYLADGTLPGGDRRPDLRDYAHWIEAQDLAPARDFWQRAAPRPDAASSVTACTSAWPAAEATGHGRARVRLTSSEAARLSAWAGRWGATVSGALQAAWALMLFRAAGAGDPMPVRFSVAVSGRGIPLDGVERLPGALCNPLPVSVEVDPAATVPELLAGLRDQAIDLASYEWVSAGQIDGWAGGMRCPSGAAGQTADSLLVFESSLGPLDRLAPSLAAQGIRMELPETTGAATAFPVTLFAHHDEAGGLVLSVNSDRTRPTDATGLLARCADLLRELPDRADESTPIAGGLDAFPAAAAPWPAFVTLRPGAGGVVCLVPSPGVPRSWYALLSRLYTGPESVVLLRRSPDGVQAWYEALRDLAGAGKPLVLGAYSGGGAGAYETARLLAADGHRPPLVVLSADTGTGEAVRGLARLLDAAARRPAAGEERWRSV
ncbi:condensation domain-containing protein [Streptomyces sp. NPDC048612]|uniref:condensation domain-containing protein n=1 Tax=Streptomyces sp. NPDC048612 TaxID=3365579 RepID=UPI00371AF599